MGSLEVSGIQVIVRVRPPTSQEAALPPAVKVDEDANSISVTGGGGAGISGSFDRVLGPSASQEDAFDALMPSLAKVAKGYNACVFAYGQTGSGKTHTMMGPPEQTGEGEDSNSGNQHGVIPRAMRFLFEKLYEEAVADESFTFSVHASYLQIYNEQIVDLLREGGTAEGESLRVREEAPIRRGRSSGTSGARKMARVFVVGLSEYRVTSPDEVISLIKAGSKRRSIRATRCNEASSRSHAILQLRLDMESSADDDPDGRLIHRHAKLSLVDLAGSEKMDVHSHISQQHFDELRSINLSLTALGNVVAALAGRQKNGTGPAPHIPYRVSKLTRLLQDSLGGNTRTAVICCVSPALNAAHETTSTILFADRAKQVTVRLRPNEVIDDRVLLARANAEIQRLRTLVLELQQHTGVTDGDGLHAVNGNSSNGGTPHSAGGDIASVMEANARLVKENNELRMQVAKLLQTPAPGASMHRSGSKSSISAHRKLTSNRKRPGDTFIPSPPAPLFQRRRETDAHTSTNQREDAGMHSGSIEVELEGVSPPVPPDYDEDVLAAEAAAVAIEVAALRRICDELSAAEVNTEVKLKRQRRSLDTIATERQQLEAQLASMVSTSQATVLVSEAEKQGDLPHTKPQNRIQNSSQKSVPEENRASSAENDPENFPENDSSEAAWAHVTLQRIGKFAAGKLASSSAGAVRPASHAGSSVRQGRHTHAHALSPQRRSLSSTADGYEHDAQGNNMISVSPLPGSAPNPGVHSSTQLNSRAASVLAMSAAYSSPTRRRKGNRGNTINSTPMNSNHTYNMHTSTIDNPSSQGDGLAFDSSLNDKFPALNLIGGPADVGLRLRVYSYRYDGWYECSVVRYDRSRRMHLCVYELTGDRQWHDLSGKKVEVVGRGTKTAEL